MSLIVFAIIVIVVLALVIFAIRANSTLIPAPWNGLLQALSAVLAALLIAKKAGLL